MFCARPQNFAWFLGAGASRSAGLPTAIDIIWDLKRRYYCREENQEIQRQDVLNDVVRSQIQSYMDARGFPSQWSDSEYGTYFEKIFGADKQLQRRYLKRILSEERISLSVGNRVLGALISSGLSRAVFTTNFDNVVEKSVAQVAGSSLSAFHLEGSSSAVEALNNEEFPIYCKMHGDFRYDSIKNLPVDLVHQNDELATCMANAGRRFGFIVVGYSGRDASVMNLLRGILDGDNAFPHGLFWMGLKGSPIPQTVSQLLQYAEANDVKARYVEIGTFDAAMLRLWRNIEEKPQGLNKNVQKSEFTSVSIPLPSVGTGTPLLRFNALPIRELPTRCLSLSFRRPMEWTDLRNARRKSKGRLILTKTETVWCWGERSTIAAQFGDELVSISEADISASVSAAEDVYAKGFLEDAICQAITRDRPVLSRVSRSSAYIIADAYAADTGALDPLRRVVGEASGIIPKLFSTITDEHPQAEQVRWSEAARISINRKDGGVWLVVEPDIWVWPGRSRKDAREFLDRRRQDRFNKKYNDLLSAWVQTILETEERGVDVRLTAFAGPEGAGNPGFLVGSRTAFTRRLG